MHASSWFILGAGSIGCLFAAYLQRSGHEVTLILRDTDTVMRYRQQGGIGLARPVENGRAQREQTAQPSPAARHEETVHETVAVDAIAATQLIAPVTRVLICTKAHQTLEALRTIQPALAPDAQLVLLQNGMGVREIVRAVVPHATIAHAITTEGAWRSDRFEVVHAGRGSTRVGVIDAPQQSDHIAAALRCELNIHADSAIEIHLWQKLAVNCVINPLTALRECRNGALLHEPDIHALVAALCAELSAVAHVVGTTLIPEKLEAKAFDVMRGTAANQSSMWQDLQKRRRTEIDFINGYVVRIAAHNNIPCPTHKMLLNAIKEKENALDCK